MGRCRIIAREHIPDTTIQLPTVIAPRRRHCSLSTESLADETASRRWRSKPPSRAMLDSQGTLDNIKFLISTMKTELAVLGGTKSVSLSAPVWPRFSDEDIESATWALNQARTKRDFISASFGGEALEAFEADFATFLNVDHVVSFNSGCAAIHVSLMAAGVKAGDEVIVSAYTWGQTASPILQANAIPVFADIEPDTFNLDAKSVENRITPHTSAILVVHLYGGPARLDLLKEVADRHGVKVVEDCAQANGATYLA